MALAQPELEAAFCALLMREANRWADVADRYTDKWLTDPNAVEIVTAVQDVYRSTRTMSAIQVRTSLSRRGLMNQNIENYLLMCQNYGNLGTAWKGIVQDLERAYQSRAVMDLLREEAAAVNSGEPPGEIIARLVNRALTVVRSTHERPVTMAEAVAKSFASTEARKQGLITVGCPSYIGSLDKLLTKRIQRKAVTVVAGRPGMGKSAFVQHLLSTNARYNKTPSLLVSGEMPDEDIADRELWGASNIPSGRWYDPANWTQAQDDAANKAYADVSELPIEIWAKRWASPESVAQECRRWKAAHPEGGMIAVDHLTTLALKERKGRTYAQAVGEAMAMFCQLAEELDVSMVVAAQLNRELEKREDKRPQMSDLRDSGEIEQWAQTILMLYRDEYYHPDLVDLRRSHNVVEIQVSKQRQGPTDTMALAYFDAAIMRYRDLRPMEASEYAAHCKDKPKKRRGGGDD